VTDEPPQSRFMFYATAPFVLAFLVLMPFLVRPPEPTGWIVLGACELLALFVLLGLFDSGRFWWCWRGVGAIVFAGYVAYLVAMVAAGEFLGDGRRATSSALNAAIGLVVFGLPGLWYAIFGRLTLRPHPELADESNERLAEDEF